MSVVFAALGIFAQIAAAAPNDTTRVEVDRAPSEIAALDYVSFSDGTVAMEDDQGRLFQGSLTNQKGEELLGETWRKTSIQHLAKRYLGAPGIQWGAPAAPGSTYYLLMDLTDVRAMRLDEAQPVMATQGVGLAVILVDTRVFERTPGLIAHVLCHANPTQRLAAVQRAVLDAAAEAAPTCAASEDRQRQAALNGLYQLHMHGLMSQPPIVLSGTGELVALGNDAQELVSRVLAHRAQRQ